MVQSQTLEVCEINLEIFIHKYCPKQNLVKSHVEARIVFFLLKKANY